jgi:hypothetical protein
MIVLVKENATVSQPSSMSAVAGSNGWSVAPPRRARRPARQKQLNPLKTVKPTPRGKYGLPRRDELLLQSPLLDHTAPAQPSRTSADYNKVSSYIQLNEASLIVSFQSIHQLA